MARSRIYRGGRRYVNRKHCVACKEHTDIAGELSHRGLCDACAILHMVANVMGMTHVFYYDEEINNGIQRSYTGPVIKAA